MKSRISLSMDVAFYHMYQLQRHGYALAKLEGIDHRYIALRAPMYEINCFMHGYVALIALHAFSFCSLSTAVPFFKSLI